MAVDLAGDTEMKLDVRYRGRAVNGGRMAAVDLGPAIFAVGEIFGAAARELYRDEASIRVEVQADLQRASFGIEFFAVALPGGLVPQLTLQDLANVAAILGFAGITPVAGYMGVTRLIRWVRSRKIDRVERVGDNIQITINDQSTNVTVNEYRIFVNPEVRKGFKNLTAPLEKPGIDEVLIEPEGLPPERITREERSSFQNIPSPEEEVDVANVTAVLEIVQPSLKGDYMWRFAQGNDTFQAEVADQAFLRRVAAREPFAAGDALRVEMEVRTIRTADGWRYQRTVTRVTHHFPNVPGGGQLPLI
jgi:hypothetical protein